MTEWRDAFMYVPWIVHLRNMTYSRVWHGLFVTWLMYMCGAPELIWRNCRLAFQSTGHVIPRQSGAQRSSQVCFVLQRFKVRCVAVHALCCSASKCVVLQCIEVQCIESMYNIACIHIYNSLYTYIQHTLYTYKSHSLYKWHIYILPSRNSSWSVAIRCSTLQHVAACQSLCLCLERMVCVSGCVTQLVNMYEITLSYLWYDSFTCVTRLMHVSHSNVWRARARHDLFIHVFIHVFIHATRLARALMEYKNAMQRVRIRVPEMWSIPDRRKLKSSGLSGGNANNAARSVLLWNCIVNQCLYSIVCYSQLMCYSRLR